MQQLGFSFVFYSASRIRHQAQIRRRRKSVGVGLTVSVGVVAGLGDAQHDRERLALLAQELGAERVRRDPIRARFIRPEHEARNAHTQAAAAHKEAEKLRALTPREAATLIETKRAAAERAQQLANERAQRLHSTLDRTTTQMKPNRHGPSLGL